MSERREEGPIFEILEEILHRQKKAEELQQELNTYVLEARSDIRDIRADIAEILTTLEPPQAQSLVITFSDSKGNDMASTIALQVGQTTQATAHEFSGLAGAGVELPLAGAISWASSDATVASVDPASGLVTGVGPGQATITGTDAANGLSGSGVVSDTPVVAQSLTVDFAPAV